MPFLLPNNLQTQAVSANTNVYSSWYCCIRTRGIPAKIKVACFRGLDSGLKRKNGFHLQQDWIFLLYNTGILKIKVQRYITWWLIESMYLWCRWQQETCLGTDFINVPSYQLSTTNIFKWTNVGKIKLFCFFFNTDYRLFFKDLRAICTH